MQGPTYPDLHIQGEAHEEITAQAETPPRDPEGAQRTAAARGPRGCKSHRRHLPLRADLLGDLRAGNRRQVIDDARLGPGL